MVNTMKFQTASQILKYIKETQALQNKDLAVILNLSDSAISYIISERFQPEDLGLILNTFNFAGFESPAAFNKFIESNTDLEMSAIDFNHCTFKKQYFYDISPEEQLIVSYFGEAEFVLANQIYDLFSNNNTNYIFDDFDTLTKTFTQDGLASRVRFHLLNMLEIGEELSLVKNVGISLSSPHNKGFEIFNAGMINALEFEVPMTKAER